MIERRNLIHEIDPLNIRSILWKWWQQHVSSMDSSVEETLNSLIIFILPTPLHRGSRGSSSMRGRGSSRGAVGVAAA